MRWSLIAPYGRQTAPALLHDQEADRAGRLPTPREVIDERHWVDLMFQRALRESGVPRLRARLMWAVVSLQSFWRPAPGRFALIVLAALAGIVGGVWGLAALIRAVAAGGASSGADCAQVTLLAVPVAVIAIAALGRVARLMVMLVVGGVVLWPIAVLQLLAVGLMRLVELVAKVADPQREPITRPTALPGDGRGREPRAD